MRLAELSLLRFGPFTGLRLDFGGGDADLQLIHGVNEAGKSTARRAVSALLFGVPETTRDDHLHRKPDLRIGARLVGADGTPLAVVRRKGRKDTLLDVHERPLDEALLTRWLGGVSRELFETLFGLDHGALVQGGEELLAGRGELAESLFGAGLGVRDLHARRRELQVRAETLFKPGGQKPPLNQALREHQEARREGQRLALRPGDWLDLQQEREAAEAELNAARAARDGAAAELSRLGRLKRVLPALGRRAELLARREALGDAPLLPEDAASRRAETQRTLEDLARRQAKLQDQVQRLQGERETLRIPQALLARGEAIDALRDPLGAYRKAQRDLPGLDSQVALARSHAEDELRDLGREGGLDAAEALRVDAGARARVRGLGQQRAGLEAEGKVAAKAVADLERRRQVLEGEQQGLPAPRDPEPLRRALAQARQRGDLERQAADLDGELGALEAAAHQQLAALGLWQGPLERVAALPLPPVASIERFRKAFGELEDERRLALQRHTDTRQALERLVETLTELAAGGPVPTETELAAARRQRDGLWGQVRGRWLEGRSGPSASGALAADYQQAVGEADRLADDLWRDADRSARYARTMDERKDLEARRLDLESNLEQLDLRRQSLEAEWRDLWRPAAIDPLPPVEMQAWLGRHERLAELVGQVDQRRRQRQALAQDVAEQRLRVDRELSALGEAAAGEGESLNDLLARAEGVVLALDVGERARAQLRRDLERLARDRREAEEALAASQRARQDWQAQWAEALLPLGLGPAAGVEQAEAVLSALDRLFGHLRQARDLQHRIDQIQQDARAFAGRVQDLARECAPDLAGKALDAAAEVLVTRLEQARADSRQRADLDRRLKEATAELADLMRDRESAQAVLARLMEQAACQDLACLEAAEQRSAELRSIHAGLAQLEQGLAAEGVPLERLLEEARDADPDHLPAQIAEAGAQHREHAAQCERLGERVGELKTRLEAMDGGPQAADAAGRAQEALARIRDHVDAYVRVRLAGLVLQRVMERYREAHQGPLLRRTGEMFQRMTLGAFDGLATGFDERDQTVLLCRTPGGDRLPVEGLSEGTRDQLYLALRLASLERHVTANEPLPLVVDDILVNFDDRRARATLELLAELSRHTQVLFFTHHTHLRDLAREAVPAERLREHDLVSLSAAVRADGRAP